MRGVIRHPSTRVVIYSSFTFPHFWHTFLCRCSIAATRAHFFVICLAGKLRLYSCHLPHLCSKHIFNLQCRIIRRSFCLRFGTAGRLYSGIVTDSRAVLIKRQPPLFPHHIPPTAPYHRSCSHQTAYPRRL